MEKPLHTPRQNPIIRKFNELVAPTAASACTPKSFPTIIVSTKLYSCWNNNPISIGTEKPRINFIGDPVVISFTIVIEDEEVLKRKEKNTGDTSKSEMTGEQLSLEF